MNRKLHIAKKVHKCKLWGTYRGVAEGSGLLVW